MENRNTRVIFLCSIVALRMIYSAQYTHSQISSTVEIQTHFASDYNILTLQ